MVKLHTNVILIDVCSAIVIVFDIGSSDNTYFGCPTTNTDHVVERVADECVWNLENPVTMIENVFYRYREKQVARNESQSSCKLLRRLLTAILESTNELLGVV